MKIALTLIVFLAIGTVYAQNSIDKFEFIINGKIINNDGLPIEDVYIYSQYIQNGITYYTKDDPVITNSDGEFSFGIKNKYDTLYLRINMIDYTYQSASVFINKSIDTVITLEKYDELTIVDIWHAKSYLKVGYWADIRNTPLGFKLIIPATFGNSYFQFPINYQTNSGRNFKISTAVDVTLRRKIKNNNLNTPLIKETNLSYEYRFENIDNFRTIENRLFIENKLLDIYLLTGINLFRYYEKSNLSNQLFFIVGLSYNYKSFRLSQVNDFNLTNQMYSFEISTTIMQKMNISNFIIGFGFATRKYYDEFYLNLLYDVIIVK